MVTIAIKLLHFQKLQRDLKEQTFNPNNYVTQKSKLLSIQMKKKQIINRTENIFQIILSIIISLVLLLTVSSQLMVCLYIDTLDFSTAFMKIELQIQLILQFIVALTFMSLACFMRSFASEYLSDEPSS
jgi:hypothetical protein